MELDSPPCCRLGACVCVVWEVYLCMDRATWRVPVEGDAELTVRGDETVTPMNNASVPVPPPLFSGRPIARRVPRPSQPSFPHGKYLTLTVAHVCHITLRFRRRKKKNKNKKTLYVWWMMELCNRSPMKRHFILLWCINCLEHTYICTHLLSTLLLTPALPQVSTHTHNPSPPPTTITPP